MLGWVGIQHSAAARHGSVNVLDLATGKNVSHPLPGRPGFLAETTKPGVLLIGLERRLVLFDLNKRTLDETGIAIPDDERVIINDGIAVEGGVLFGTKHLEFNQPIAALYFYDVRTRRLSEVLSGQTCSNGKMLKQEGGKATLIALEDHIAREERGQ